MIADGGGVDAWGRTRMARVVTGLVAALAMTTFKGSTVSAEHVHFRIVVPEYVNTHTHTKMVYVLPGKGSSDLSAPATSPATSLPTNLPITPGSLLSPEQVSAGHSAILAALQGYRHGKACHNGDKGHGHGHGQGGQGCSGSQGGSGSGGNHHGARHPTKGHGGGKGWPKGGSHGPGVKPGKGVGGHGVFHGKPHPAGGHGPHCHGHGPGHNHPTHGQGGNDHPSHGHGPGHNHPSHGHGGNNHPSHGHGGNNHPSHGHGGNNHPSHGHGPGHNHPSHGHGGNNHPSHGHGGNNHPSHGHGGNNHPSHGHGGNNHPSHGHGGKTHPSHGHGGNKHGHKRGKHGGYKNYGQIIFKPNDVQENIGNIGLLEHKGPMLLCSHGESNTNQLLCVATKNIKKDENKESKHFYDDAWSDAKHEVYGTKDENYKVKEHGKNKYKEIGDGHGEYHTGGGTEGTHHALLVDGYPAVSAEASSPGASIEEFTPLPGPGGDFKQADNGQWIPITPSSYVHNNHLITSPSGLSGPTANGGQDFVRDFHVEYVPSANLAVSGPSDGGPDLTAPEQIRLKPTTPTNVLGVQHNYRPLKAILGEGSGHAQPHGSHLDGTEEQLLLQPGPNGYQVAERPSDYLSSEVHLTTSGPGPSGALGLSGPSAHPADGMALYFHDDSPTPSATGDPRYLDRGRVKYTDYQSGNGEGDIQHDGGGEIHDSDRLAVEHEADAAREELAQDGQRLLASLQRPQAQGVNRRKARNKPKRLTETGHILRGLEVKKTVEANKW